VDYDPGWPGRFAEQKVLVERLLRPACGTGHGAGPGRCGLAFL